MLDLDSISPDFPIPRYLYKGQVVYAPYDGEKSVKCKVITACGDVARVVCEPYNFDRWFSIWHLRIKKGSLGENYEMTR